VTVTFWITMTLIAGMTETGSHYLVDLVAPVAAVAISGIALLAALVLQVAAGRYVPWVYWLAVALVGLFGTVAVDALQAGLDVPSSLSAVFLACVLAGLFALWQASETTVSIHSIYTNRREAFYWAAVMVTFGLGSAAVDLTAVTLHLGYLASGVIFAVLTGAVAAQRRFGLNAISAFWLAYLGTRLLGGSLAYWLGAAHAERGLGLGSGRVSVALLVLVAGFVGYLKDNPATEGVADTHLTS
jgi:uncharacterized membrane-anchored protein